MSLFLSIFTGSCNHHLYKIPDHFHHPQKRPRAPVFPFSGPLASINLLSVSVHLNSLALSHEWNPVAFVLFPPSTFPRLVPLQRVSALFLFTDGNVPLYGSTAFCVSIHLPMDVFTEFLVPCGASLASPEPWSGPHVAPDLGGLSPPSQGLGPSWKSSRPRLPGGRLLLGKVLPPYYPWLVLDSILSFLRLLPEASVATGPGCSHARGREAETRHPHQPGL